MRVYLAMAFVLLTCVSAHATLIRDGEFLVENETGIRWVVTDPIFGAVVPADLPPFRRYATGAEAYGFLQRNLFIYGCEFNISSFCVPGEFQKVKDFIAFLVPRTAISPPLYSLVELFAADAFGAGYWHLSANDPNNLYFDIQTGNPPPQHDTGMLLIAETPEPSTLALFGFGLLLLARLRRG